MICAPAARSVPDPIDLPRDLTRTGAVGPGVRFCASVVEGLASKLPSCPVNAFTWPEILRMVRPL